MPLPGEKVVAEQNRRLSELRAGYTANPTTHRYRELYGVDAPYVSGIPIVNTLGSTTTDPFGYGGYNYQQTPYAKEYFLKHGYDENAAEEVARSIYYYHSKREPVPEQYLNSPYVNPELNPYIFSYFGTMDDKGDAMLDVLGKRARENLKATGESSAVSDIYGNLMTDYKKAQADAKAANESRYQEAKRGYQERYGRGMAGIEGMGKTREREIKDDYAKMGAASKQSAASRGLGNTTVTDSLARGVQADRQKALGAHGEQLAREKLDYDAQLSGDLLGLIERREDVYPSMEGLASLASEYGKTQLLENFLDETGGVTGDTLTGRLRSQKAKQQAAEAEAEMIHETYGAASERYTDERRAAEEELSRLLNWAGSGGPASGGAGSTGVVGGVPDGGFQEMWLRRASDLMRILNGGGSGTQSFL